MEKIRVTIIRGTEPGISDTVITSYPSFDSSELTARNQVLDAVDEIDSFLAAYEPDSNIADSVYDLVGSTQKESTVAAEIIAQQTWNEAVGHYTAAVLSALGKITGVNWVIEVKFSDSSIALFKIDGIGYDGALDISFFEGTDSSGNTVPMTKEQFSSLGQMTFLTQRLFDEYSDAALRLNVSISLPSGSTGGGSGAWHCVPSDSGVVCKPY